MSRRLKVLELMTRYKELKEEQAKIELFKTQQLLKKLVEEKQKAKEGRNKLYQEMEKKKVMNAEEFLNYFNSVNFLREKERIFESKIKNQEKKAERWREELIRFHNEKRLVERLRDKVRQEWLREQEKSFFKEMDELTILKTKVSE
jgi:flagellar biosynthesis chaperone FliJ